MASAPPLAGIEILEYGSRIAVGACGSVLAALGARIKVVAVPGPRQAPVPPAQREGKRILHAGDPAGVREALAAADVVIASTDVHPLPTYSRPARQIGCDITAYGTSGPMAGVAHDDALVQAMSGLADTTGEPDSPPTLCRFPQTEGIAALYAAAGILTALHVRTHAGYGQQIEIAMFDCAFSTLSTFLPFHFIGKPVSRSGNQHVLASPWNAYRAGDGWLLICTGSDEQWKRLCEVIGRPELARDPCLAKAPDRVQHRDRVDGAVQAWIAGLRAADAAAALQARGIASGPVVPAQTLAEEPNIRHRGMYTALGMRSAIRYFRALAAEDRVPQTDVRERGVPAPAEGLGASKATNGRFPATAWMPEQTVRADTSAADLPLAGLKVLEIGQYTTAPLVARNLGALGAEVLKIEPPGGDATRAWPPQHAGQGYFFTLTNSDKRSLCLDLRDEAEREQFRHLLIEADVLVENLKPGSLEKLGFGPGERRALNPRLVYCAISGFGADSAYPGRPAFDSVIQAMSGIMDLIRVREVPQKTGISFADVLGGLFALNATLAALIGRERSGCGDAIDLSMQDAAAWITQWKAACADLERRCVTVECTDGYIVAETADRNHPLLGECAHRTRAAAVDRLMAHAIPAASVQAVSEVAESAQARARQLLEQVSDSCGRHWPVFASPIRLSKSPARARRAIGPLGEANTN